MSGTTRTARWLAFSAFLVYVLTGGGRIVGSDEVTMLEVSRAMLRGGIAVPEGATTRGPDGSFYSKNAPGQAVLALPLVAVATGAARILGLEGARRELAVRFGVSFFNAIVTAILLGVFYAGVRRLGAGAGAGLAATLMLGFATPLWVYSKSFMAEPLQALGLLLTLLGASDPREGTGRADGGSARAPEWRCALGLLLAVSAKLSMLPLALACLAPMACVPPRRWRIPALGLGTALLGHALYNAARFGTPFETGYGAQATPAAYSTPILVGLYGLLLSSGKGVLWFAPPLWLVSPGAKEMLRSARSGASDWAGRLGLRHRSGRAAWSAACATAVALLLYARFQHWAGDGSFGPRYLIPVLPLLFTAVAFALSEHPAPAAAEVGPRDRSSGEPGISRRPSPMLRTLAALLAVLGVLVQIGGVAVYFGAQMREAGDYPYTRALEDPRFMSESHFNPRFSPIVDHWRMLGPQIGRAHV